MSTPVTPRTFTAFEKHRRLATGELVDVALKAQQAGGEDVVIFDDLTGEAQSLNLHGTPEQLRARLEKRLAREAAEAAEEPAPAPRTGPGRPRLGVVSREVTLLPRHWQWLEDQPAGISGTLRRLVDEARKANEGRDRARKAREAVDRFMSVIAGDLPGYEEASRAVYASDWERLDALLKPWPKDVRDHVRRLAQTARTLAGSAATAG